jgi:hypothetical protein
MRIKINKDQSLDELYITLQLVLAWLQDNNVQGFKGVNIYLTPLRADGEEKTLPQEKNEHFQTVKQSSQGGGSRGRSPKNKRRY